MSLLLSSQVLVTVCMAACVTVCCKCSSNWIEHARCFRVAQFQLVVIYYSEAVTRLTMSSFWKPCNTISANWRIRLPDCNRLVVMLSNRVYLRVMFVCYVRSGDCWNPLQEKIGYLNIILFHMIGEYHLQSILWHLQNLISWNVKQAMGLHCSRKLRYTIELKQPLLSFVAFYVKV